MWDFQEHLRGFSWVDIVVLVVILRTLCVGAKRGLIPEFLTFVGLLVGVVISLQHAEALATALAEWTRLPLSWLVPVGIGLLLGVTWILLSLLRFLGGKLFNLKASATLDRYGGGILGTLRGIVIASFILVFLCQLPAPKVAENVRKRSFSGNFIIRVAPWIYRWMVEMYPFRTETKTGNALISKD